jgi:tetratricopeptide (TPR) repeat protein
MKTRKATPRYLLISIAMLLPATSLADTEPAKIEDVIAAAKVTHKPVFIEFYTDSCAPCKVFAKMIEEPNVVSALHGVTLVRYDAEKGNGILAAARYQVTAYPTIVAIDDTGAARDKSTGSAGNSAEFIAFINTASVKLLPEAQVKARRMANPNDAAIALATGEWYLAHDNPNDAQPHLEAALKLDPANATHVAERAAWKVAALRRASADRRFFAKQVAELVKKYPTAPEAAENLATARLELTPAQRKSLWHTVIAAQDSADALNEMAYGLLADGELDAAGELATRMLQIIDKQPAAKGTAGLLDTVAEIYNYRRDTKKALEISDRAIALEKQQPDGRPHPLEINRARFASKNPLPSPDVQNQMASSDSGDSQSAMQTKFMVYNAQRNEIFRTVGQTCKRDAASMKEAYVRLVMKKDGTVEKTTLLEPDAPKLLGPCLQNGLRAAKLPTNPFGSEKSAVEVVAIPLTAVAAH